ncbi:MerR family transcriptional regulator [Herbiconiux sp. CPCC 205763]|uniref:MerR family transcriptional regulator n=1 Tax=Herbiconiux aconitum TaxID=2970913 RepID=A0ABT2GUN7_9MICO|nr:MerR family transcriptional regulator [Herbiconiux aconitum]MCS5719922.1 MerR family transcriptional regulator [Herbiconiux aconitum]
MTMTDEPLSIAEVAELVGVSTHTLRYYEREGLLLHPIGRASSTHRRYTEGDVTWLRFLTKLRLTAMPISRIKEYAVLARDGADTEEARLELLLRHRMSVVAQLGEMTKSLAAIDYKIASYKERNER